MLSSYIYTNLAWKISKTIFQPSYEYSLGSNEFHIWLKFDANRSKGSRFMIGKPKDKQKILRYIYLYLSIQILHKKNMFPLFFMRFFQYIFSKIKQQNFRLNITIKPHYLKRRWFIWRIIAIVAFFS